MEEIDKLSIDPTTGVLFRQLMMDVIDKYKLLNHWQSRDIYDHKQAETAEESNGKAIAAVEAKKQSAQKMPKIAPTPIKELSRVPYSGQKKG